MIPRGIGWSATRRGVVVERRVDVRAEAVSVDRRRAGERGDCGVGSDELAGLQGNQLADGHAVARHDERFAAVEGAHDLAAAVAQFPLSDLAGHDVPYRSTRATRSANENVGGAAVTETVFSYPGMGKLLIDSILRQDFPQIQASIIVLTIVYLIVNLLVDLTYGVLDPRIRTEQMG
jgi:hypothetical protein